MAVPVNIDDIWTGFDDEIRIGKHNKEIWNSSFTLNLNISI